MSSGDYRAASARIRQELPALDGVVARALGAWAGATGADDDYLVDATALNLHGFYAGLERVFLVVAERVDDAVPQGANRHQELLQQMAAELAGIRPAVLDHGTATRLEDFRGFRHIVRNVYAQRLDPVRIKALVSQLPEVWSDVAGRLLAFAGALDEIAGD